MGNNKEKGKEPTMLQAHPRIVEWQMEAQKLLQLQGKSDNATLEISPREFLVWNYPNFQECAQVRWDRDSVQCKINHLLTDF